MAHGVGEVVVEIRVVVRIGMDLVDVLEPQPLRGEPGAERLGPRVRQHPARLLLERPGRRQLALAGERQQLRIGWRAPEEERKTRRQIDVSHAVRATRLGRVRFPFEPEDEIRTGQDRFERGADARIKPTGATRPGRRCRTRVKERHQTLDFCGANRTAVRVSAEAREDLSRAWPLFVRCRRPACKDLPATRRLGDAGDLVRTFNNEVPQVRQRRDARTAGSAARVRPFVRANQILVRTLNPPHERGRHTMLPSLDRNRLGPDAAAAATVSAARGPALVLEQRDPLAIDGDVDVFKPRVGSRNQRKLEHILRVGGKRVLDDDPAARAVRRAFKMIPGMLRDIARVGIRVVDGGRVAVADGHAADRACGVEIRLEQRGRQRLLVGDVVEVGVLRIERQPIAGVHVERQEIVNRARVLRTIEALKGPDPRVRSRRGRGVHRRFERSHQRRMGRGIRMRRCRRRHVARLQLADHLLGHFGVLTGASHVERRQRQPTGLSCIAMARRAIAANHGVVFLHG